MLRAPADRRVVAAVPVRCSGSGAVEFLVVRTSTGDRWTLPKGGCERGETLPEAAAREALEEAGVAGSIGAEPLAEYHYGGDVVTAFLLVVEHLVAPQEPARDPTWFGLEAARAKLAEGRPEGFAAQMERVLRKAERAVAGR